MASPACSFRAGLPGIYCESGGSPGFLADQRRWGRRPHRLLSISQPPVWAAAPAAARSCNGQ
jgi:hypothetical protein